MRHLVDSYNATPEKVADFISGKEEPFIPYQARQHYIKSLFDPKWQDKLKYYSYISNGIRGTQPGSDLREDYAHLVISNASALDLYVEAYTEVTRYDFTRPSSIILHVTDSFRYVRPRDNNFYAQWFEAYSYNYDLQVCKEKEGEMHRIMQEDLGRYFNLRATVHKKVVLCWVLLRTSPKDKVASKSKVSSNNFRLDDIREPVHDSMRYLYRTPYKTFSLRMGGWIEQGLKRPFIDATGFNELVDIQIPGDVIDNIDAAHLPELRKALHHYDLDLVAKMGKIDVLEIRDGK